MFGFLKKRRLPAGQRPDLAADERVLSWAGTTGDNVVVVTNLGLWLPGAGERLGWHEIHKATWSGRQLTLIAARELPADGPGGYVVMQDLPPLVLALLDPDRVPEQVRTRVNKSIAHTSHHPLEAGFGVRVVARRVSGVDGLRWTVRYDEGVDPAAPGVAEQTATLVSWARDSIGTPATA
ncbi:hypothetical protein ACFPIJ_27495 [Dactylosporangium cerinum]|uniref:DUF317 domain-containing protein n=1 Tax=Dactylosporangium cerinum TaxID=1434730 RepID=A0ABV9W0N3_9ACTN